ncbi:PLP-dependent aminotransferase family protein [Curtobacterium flaccumfaciens]|uniref:aminotransferase-like domain-containing protein n=1 Tax=Curtobacterium flaccumfaciens TaxID=2035 RepID=UPI001BDF6588|nr:PLP-dependent aminotransferase family protein [Curtobacterium flaccumfaciens]MBT1672830.1 PLP-dependent aminotransferase family protein [Curtobacterium flaccumfaciens pv. flaccumfaciens]
MTNGAQGALASGDLHRSVFAPQVATIDFLNTVSRRYPMAISFAAGAPDLGLIAEEDFERYLDRFRKYRGSAAVAELRAYGPNGGLINELLSAMLAQDQGVEVAPDELVVTVGAQEALLLAFRALSRGMGDVIGVVMPAFPGATGALDFLDVARVAIPEASDGIDTSALGYTLDKLRTERRKMKAIYLAPDYSNPSGTVMSPDARRDLIEVARREGIILIEDNTYAFMASKDLRVPSLLSLAPDVVVQVGTFSKILFPGVRVGYLASKAVVMGHGGNAFPLAGAFGSLKGMTSVNTSPLSQAVVGGYLLANDCSLTESTQYKAKLYREKLRHLLSALDATFDDDARFRWSTPSGGFFVVMDVPFNADVAMLQDSAGRGDVAWAPMRSFYDDESGDLQLRLSPSNLSAEQIEVGVQRLARFLRQELTGSSIG